MSQDSVCLDKVALYCDGGLALDSPSKIGGSWAWVQVLGGQKVREASGFCRPGDLGLARLSSNVAELLATLRALESVPDSWRGTLYTDSHVTLRRVCARKYDMKGVPGTLRRRLETARQRLGTVRCVLVTGHPTALDLRRGCGRTGRPASAWNVLCDRLCQEEIRLLLQEEHLL